MKFLINSTYWIFWYLLKQVISVEDLYAAKKDFAENVCLFSIKRIFFDLPSTEKYTFLIEIETLALLNIKLLNHFLPMLLNNNMKYLNKGGFW